MKQLFIIASFLLFACPAFSQNKDKKPDGIDKNDCTITVKGKTYPLYGKVKIVESFPDVKVKIVESFPDVKVQIVESFPDIKVKLVESFPRLK